MIRQFGAVLVVFTAACASQPATFRDLERMSSDYERGGASPLAATETRSPTDSCGARIFRPRIGTPITNWEPPEGARVIHPGQPVTDDHRPDRLNIIVDADGRVTALECY